MNNQNLKPIRTESEAREKGRKGGIASGIERRKRKTMRELLEYWLEQPNTNMLCGETNAEAMTYSLLMQAINGNVKAYEIIRDTIGENPKNDLPAFDLPIIIDDVGKYK